MNAAADSEIGDRFRLEQRTFERFNGTDVGLGAPARTSTPMPERAMSVRVAALIAPASISASGGRPVIMTSNGSPARARRELGRQTARDVSRWPVVCSNCGPISASTVAIARAVQL